MGQRKVLAGSLGLALVGLVAVSCGKSSKTPSTASGGGQGGEANVDPGEGGAFTAGRGGAATEAGRGGRGIAGDASGGVSGVAGEPNGGASLGGAGDGGSGGAASDGCVYRGKPHAVGEHFAGHEYWQVCECNSGGDVSCVDGCGGWLTTETYRLLGQAKDCDPSKPAQCEVLKTVNLPFAGDYVSFFNEASLGALDGLKELDDLHSELDCDAPITLPEQPVPPTVAYCGSDGRCKDFWYGLNLLKNGGFEDANAGTPTSWVLTPAPAFALQADAHTGGAALAVTLSDTGVTYRLATSVVLPSGGGNSELWLSGFYRIDRIDSEVSMSISLDIFSVDDPSFVLPAPATAGEWLPFAIGVDASGENVGVAFNLRLVAGPATTVAFDDLNVVQTTGR